MRNFRIGHRSDRWAGWRRPDTLGHAKGAKVFGPDIPGRVEVGVEREAARPATEQRLCLSVGPVGVSASRAGLAGLPWVDNDDPGAEPFRFVFDKGPQLLEAPAVEPPALFLAGLCSFADIGQVLQNDGCPGGSRGDDVFGEDVVAVAPESSLASREDFKAAFGRLGSFGLKFAALTENPVFGVFPPAFSEKFAIAGDRRAVDPEINADAVITVGGWRGKLDDDVKPPVSFFQNQVGGADLATGERLEIGRYFEGERHLPGGAAESDLAICPINPESVAVVAGRAKAAFRTGNLAVGIFAESESRTDRLGGFDAGLDMQVADQKRVAVFEPAIGKVVKLDAVFLVSLPSCLANVIKAVGELFRGGHERLGLLPVGLELDSDGSLHK